MPSPDATLRPDGGEGGSPYRARASLVDHDLWTLAEGANDPFAAERPDGSWTCEPGSGYGAEPFERDDPPNGSFFISTLWCDYATFEQPSLVDILEGDIVDLNIWRSDLESPSGDWVHVAVRIADELGWEETLFIPHASGVIHETWTAPRTIPAGTPVLLHLHNHGANEYSVRTLTTGPAPP